MSKSMTIRHTGAGPLLDRLFAGGCTAVFLLLTGVAVVQAVYVYWG